MPKLVLLCLFLLSARSLAVQACFGRGNKESQLVADEVTPEISKAVERGDMARVEQLIADGVDVAAKDPKNFNWTPIHYAASQNQVGPACLIIKKDLNLVNTPDASGDTPLITAAVYNSQHMCRFLITHGANVDAINKWGKTAIIYAAYWGNLEAVRCLYEEGKASLSVKGNDEPSANQWAATRRHRDIVVYFQSKEVSQ